MKRQLTLAALGLAAGIGGMLLAGVMLRGVKTKPGPGSPPGLTAPAASGTGAGETAETPASDPKAQAVYERLEQGEQKLRSGRVELRVEQRATRLAAPSAPSGSPEAVESARRIVAVVKPDRRRERIVFDSERILRETTVIGPEGKVRRKGIGANDGKMARFLDDVGGERVAIIGDMPAPDPALQLALGRGSEYLREAVWTSVEETGDGTVLTGTMDGARLVATLAGNPLRVHRVERTEEGSTPQGAATRVFEIDLTYGSSSALLPKVVEEFVYLRGSVNAAATTRLVVDKSELNVTPAAAEFALRIPSGTPVQDRRVDPPVEYVYTGAELSLTQLAKKQEEQEAARVGVGKKAPDWSLKTLDGGSVNAKNYLGKVVFLTWFASW